MKKDTVNTLCFTPFYPEKGREKLYRVLLITVLSSLTLPGCVTSDTSAPLAPQPPEINMTTIEDQHVQPHYFADVMSVDPVISVGIQADDVGFEKRSDVVAPDANQVKAITEDNCRVQDRFDRKAVIAYEWGHERLALDVDGVGLDGGDDSGVRLEYKVNLQRKKTSKQKCRYSSKWQGLIGSGYNEMFLRQEDTVWEDLKDMRKDVSDYVNGRF